MLPSMMKRENRENEKEIEIDYTDWNDAMTRQLVVELQPDISSLVRNTRTDPPDSWLWNSFQMSAVGPEIPEPTHAVSPEIPEPTHLTVGCGIPRPDVSPLVGEFRNRPNDSTRH
jgi:hypothetical protein